LYKDRIATKGGLLPLVGSDRHGPGAGVCVLAFAGSGVAGNGAARGGVSTCIFWVRSALLGSPVSGHRRFFSRPVGEMFGAAVAREMMGREVYPAAARKTKKKKKKRSDFSQTPCLSDDYETTRLRAG
jgi:hypothetical protein